MATGVSSTPTVLLYLLAIILPPVAVFLDTACSTDLAINICLTILGWIPGILHAWYVIAKHEDARSRGATDPVFARVTPAAPASATASTAPPAGYAVPPTSTAAKY